MVIIAGTLQYCRWLGQLCAPPIRNVASNILALEGVAPGEAERLLLQSASALREAKSEISSLFEGHFLAW